jgi:hypothetical protein
MKRLYCVNCDQLTEHEHEATLPEQYKCGDPDYEDKTKCGFCGENYVCAECGADWNTEENQCDSVITNGDHLGSEENDTAHQQQ